MRHRNAGFKLGRNTSHRRALLRNLVTSVIVEDRVETTVAKAKAVRPHVEKMITLGKKGDLHSRRQALSFLQTDTAVTSACLKPWRRVTATARAAICASSAPASARAMAARRRSSNSSAPKSNSRAKRQKRDEIKAKKRAELEKQLEESKKDEEKGGEEAA